MIKINDKLKMTRIVWLAGLAFMMMLSYSISRPATESLFLKAHTSQALPVVWLLVAATMAFTVGVYNKFVVKMDLVRLLGASSAISAVILVILLFMCSVNFPGSYYALYVWKDIHVMILLETYYSFANSVFPIKTARWVYGLFGICSAFGDMAGNLSVGYLAKIFGSSNALLFVPPILLAVSISSYALSSRVGIGKPLDVMAEQGIFKRLSEVMRKSSYLPLVLMLILLLQVVSTLIDFKFNSIVEGVYPEVDQRTGIIGKVYAAVSFGGISLHLLTGPILRLFGVPLTLLSIPLILGVGVGAFAALPRFMMMAAVKVANKCFDYTLFRSAKEILYIPLNYAERTMGKSVVDILTHRVAKGGASLLLLGLVAIGAQSFVIYLTLILIAIWFVITLAVAKKFRKKVSRKKEMSAEKEISGFEAQRI